MKVLIASAVASAFAAPALATPSDAFTLCVLLCATAFGYRVISEAVSGKPQSAKSHVGSARLFSFPEDSVSISRD